LRILPSSTKPVFKIHVPVAMQARANVAAVRSGSGTAMQRRAIDDRQLKIDYDAPDEIPEPRDEAED
jgi:hypothetical protein